MTLDPLVVFGAIGTILGGVFGAGLAGKWVWGRELTEMRADRDFWRSRALRAADNADRAIDRAMTVVTNTDG